MSEPIIRTFNIPSLGTLSSTTFIGRYVVDAIHECITRSDDGKGHYWYLDTDSLSGTGIRVETNGQVSGIVLKNTHVNFDGNIKTQKLTLRSAGSFLGSGNVTWNNVSVGLALHPDGDNTQITSLPTVMAMVGSAASFPGALSSFSGETRITGGYYNVNNTSDGSLNYYNLGNIRIADGQSISGWIIELEDAITIALKTSSNNNWVYGAHAGKVLIPINFNDYENFIDGSGLFVGGPSFINSSSTGGHRWWLRGIGTDSTYANNNAFTSKIRIAENIWKTPYIVNSGNQAVASSGINGNARLSPYEIRVGTAGRETDSNIEGIIGISKYIRKGPSGSLNEVIDSQNANSNISWLRQYVSGANTLMFHIWKRNVDPITTQ